WEVTFQAVGDTTVVTATLTFESAAAMEQLITMGFKEGFAMAHTNLDALIAANALA
ncbi:MAG: SRPBCC domain-containing protein, partial [Chitinophagia bacterium]|nr:SRPBCC domain-containing protein [Chitinophagia bacterium]